ncbi:MAG: YiiX/YebB-like N1pC/P60 family cysteine hydrolase, partial [Halofilum sp. (in: g-proteobacteria)]
VPPLDFERLCYEIRPCDVLLVEGRTRVSEVIKSITLSNWTHAALYVGRLHDIDSPEIRARVREHYPAQAEEQLIVEAVLGEGTIISPLSRYRGDHIRICRPHELRRRDAQSVVNHCVQRLGREYDVRQLFDLARFLLPYKFLPRRWRSSLFRRDTSAPARTICSALLAQAFASVRYPVLPVLRQDDDDQVHLQKRNFRLLTPRDFDYSPYFDVIKYPVMVFGDLAVYHQMPWDPDSVFSNGPGEEVVVDETASEESADHDEAPARLRAVSEDHPPALTADEAATEQGDERLADGAASERASEGHADERAGELSDEDPAPNASEEPDEPAEAGNSRP